MASSSLSSSSHSSLPRQDSSAVRLFWTTTTTVSDTTVSASNENRDDDNNGNDNHHKEEEEGGVVWSNNDETTTTTTTTTRLSLEERVHELETKLSVLSRLLQQNKQQQVEAKQQQGAKQRTPELIVQEQEEQQQETPQQQTPSSTDPLTIDSTTPLVDLPETTTRTTTTLQEGPPLLGSADIGSADVDTTTPSRPINKRNLSFRLLFDSNEEDYETERHNTAPPCSTMTMAEREWLGTQVQSTLRKQQQAQQLSPSQQPQQDDKTNTTTPALLNDNDDDNTRHQWLQYLQHAFPESNHDSDLQMQEFIMVPSHVETIMSFGIVICVDSFLYMITLLPIRFIWSVGLLTVEWGMRGRTTNNNKTTPQTTNSHHNTHDYRFHRRHAYPLIQVFVLYSIYRVLCQIRLGMLYHWIRGQSMIKLYVLIAIVEVFDRLLSSLGQDCMDSMYWNTVHRPKTSRMVVSVVVVWVYAVVHALMLLVHVETLNVAMNSADQALLTLLISGNFAEIKSTVFKKYNKPALFKITASDICERFKLGLFLSLILLLNVCQGMEQGQLVAYVRICAIVYCAELLSDWIKHAFMTKFNFLPSQVYREFSLLLAGDVTGIGHEGYNLDHSHAVVKRIGFAQIPLVGIMFRLLHEAVKYARRNPYYAQHIQSSPSYYWIMGTMTASTWLLLLGIKTILGRLLQRTSLAKLRAAPDVIPKEKLPKQKNKEE